MTNSNEPAAIVFDLDGTLVDSLPDMLRAMNVFLARLGRRAADLPEMGSWVGDGATVLVQRALQATGGLPDKPLTQLVGVFLDCYRGNAAIDSKPYPGVVATLERLKALGHPLAVCTNKPYDLAIELLDGLGMTALFGAVLGGDSLAVKKPDPAHLQATLAALGVEGRRALMVGDSENDVLAARGAGVPVVAVSFGYSRVDVQDLGADVVIDDFATFPVAAAGYL